MGDMADYYVGLALANGEGFAPKWRERPGYYGPRYSSYGPPLKCKHCGAKSVYWQRTREGWQLNNKDDLSRHLCRQPEQPNAEGFDDVD
jgi:hypothetical protein